MDKALPEVAVLVLTLPQAKDRQLRIKTLLDDAGIPFSFWFGVDGKTDVNPIDAIYDPKLRIQRKGASLSPGQLGCYASHYNIWRQSVALNTPYIVLEDDVTFDASLFKRFLKAVPDLPAEAGCIRLFENKRRNFRAFSYSKIDGFELLRYTKGPTSTMGYYLTPDAARKFLESAAPVFLPVDVYMDRYWANDVLCSGVKPAFIFHDYSFESMIGYETRVTRRPLLITVRRELFELSERIQRYFYNKRFKEVSGR